MIRDFTAYYRVRADLAQLMNAYPNDGKRPAHVVVCNKGPATAYLYARASTSDDSYEGANLFDPTTPPTLPDGTPHGIPLLSGETTDVFAPNGVWIFGDSDDDDVDLPGGMGKTFVVYMVTAE